MAAVHDLHGKMRDAVRDAYNVRLPCRVSPHTEGV
ncbi:hypothetical protein J2T05_004254 [Cupriavidus necator]|nr:hypothetical protein [Cupriavidus necator]